jgi:hypothetical protein
MDHETVVRQKMTEKYLLQELDPAMRDEFEEHYFDCTDCAVDVRAGALFIDQSKIVLAQKPETISARLPVPASVRSGWLAGLRGLLRPTLALPVMALLLAVIGYQNLVTYPQLTRQLNSPRVLAYATVTVGTYGSGGPVITPEPGKGFLLFVRIPPTVGYSLYTADLYGPSGTLEWSLTIPATPGQDQWPIQIPGANRESGSYTLSAHGVTASGERQDIGRASFELQIQK